MNVYLFELDSVRNSEEEIRRGQMALYEEIVRNGNTVLLSYNQLIDSPAFLSLISEEKTFEMILRLFRFGTLKVIPYAGIKTASEYVQRSIQKCLDNANNSFVFSGIPVKYDEKDRLRMLKRALVNSDISELTEAESRAEDAEKKDLSFLIRFVRLVLEVSMATLSKFNDNSQTGHNIDEMLSSAKKFLLKAESGLSDKMRVVAEKGFEIIENIREKMFEANEVTTSRSNWVRQIYTLNAAGEDKNGLMAAEALIDLSYNFTIEASTVGVSKHYDEREKNDIYKDFANRFVFYYLDGVNGVHKFLHNEPQITYMPMSFNWDRAVRLNENIKRNEDAVCPVYEEGIVAQKKERRKRNLIYILKKFFVILVNVVIFFAISYGTNAISNGIDEGVKQKGPTIAILVSLASIFLFGIISALLEKISPNLNILEALKGTVTVIGDAVAFNRIKPVAYCRKKEEKC